MKKWLYLLLSLVLVLVNLFGYLFMSKMQVFDFLYKNNHIVQIDYGKAKLSIQDAELIDALVKFSNENNINISQFNFLSEHDLNVYSTNIKKDPHIHLKSGEIPKGNMYISNKNADSSNAKQSGMFSFPVSNWKVHIYDIKQVNNVGLRDEFYFSGADTDTILAFIKEFSIYGTISVKSEKISSLVLINTTLLMVMAFSFVIFCIGMFYFLILNRKMMLLQELWGYSKWLVLFSVPRLFLRVLITLISLLFLGMLIFIVVLGQTYFLRDYILMFAIINLTAILILLLFTLIGTWSIQKFNDSHVNIKGKLPFEKIQLLSIILKIVVSISLFSLISSSLVNFYHLSNKVEALDYWNQTQNVFRVQVGILRKDIDSNLEADRDLNNRLFNLYKKIESNNKAFLMMSQNFQVIKYDNGKPIYSYSLNTKFEEYSPHGRSVIINKNYLIINPIQSSNGATIDEQVQNDEDTLNILVPEQFKDLENQIIQAYKERFYFQKVTVDNHYNKSLGYPLNEKSINDLTVNVIYTKEGQDYFTFNTYTGDSHNKIKDPIAVLYNDSVDTSSIGAYATTSLFFLDSTKGSAFESISPSIAEANVFEINNAISVFNEANDQIVQQQWLLFQQIIGLVITIIFSGILIIAFIWAYYNANIYQLNLKYLFGYSYWKRNKYIIISTIISNVISGLLVYLFYNVTIIIPLVGFVLIIDLLVINILSGYLSKKNMNKVLKGDRL
ncbi:DUF1430 domain-containing protein [Paenibacillus eucommiae]|uniref:ABC transport system permease protein n=1 Tax=Paenibacillus eucommiae TaxID=1355755 RepID=A0ABS4J7K2_9BACL|nr:DUF1430 domain-containing protein [Paenibacillus eucommiae]MBP1995829.1 putative ABC transport system permease protein [Paenibacillus eucommiae]